MNMSFSRPFLVMLDCWWITSYFAKQAFPNNLMVYQNLSENSAMFKKIKSQCLKNDPGVFQDIQDITYDPDDPGVAFVGTSGHGFFILTKKLKVGGVIYPFGTCVGEEDAGVDKIALGWKSNYGKDGPAFDEDEC